jgi:aspartate-semialdehyde dehydrogenase
MNNFSQLAPFILSRYDFNPILLIDKVNNQILSEATNSNNCKRANTTTLAMSINIHVPHMNTGVKAVTSFTI